MFLSQKTVARSVVGLALVGVVGVGSVGPAAAAGGGGGLKLSAVAFAQQSVDASGGGASVELDWTIADGDAAATDVTGDILIQQVGPSGQGIGPSYSLSYAFDSYADVSPVSGTAQSSVYSYDFTVPQYAATATAQWAVVKVTATDDQSHSLSVGRDKLAAIAGTSFTADELVDSTGPTYVGVSLPSQSPVDFDDAAAPVDLTYTVEATDPESGFYKGTLVLTGPQGQTVSTDFAVQFDALGTTECGPDSPSWGSNDIICAVPVVIPQGSAAGTWSVSQLKLTNAAGVVANYRKLALDPITLTQNAVLSASGFSMTPSVVDNWVNKQNLTVTMTPAGAQDGIASVTVDTTPWCYGGTTNQPTVAADGTLSVTVQMFQGPGNKSCQVTGIAIADGAGDVAAYGSANNGPALNLVSTQLPDTAPTLLSAALATTSVVHGDSQADTLTMNVSSIAGIDQATYSIYASDGSWAVVSASQNYYTVVTGGTITLPIYPGSLAPGTYTIALVLNDANQLGTGYGAPNGVNTPMPGGPLQFTVTAS